MDANQIRQEISKLGDKEKTKQVVEWLHDHLPKFEGLGIPSDSITNALQVELIERACAARNKIQMGEWFANVGGLLLAAHAAGVDLERGGQVPNHHLSLELIKYAVGRFLGEGGDPAGLRDLLIAMVNDLSTQPPPPKPDVN